MVALHRIGGVFEYRVPWDAFRDVESGGLADGGLTLLLTTTDGSQPPPWLWLVGPDAELHSDAPASAEAHRSPLPRVDLVVRGSRAAATAAAASGARASRAPLAPLPAARARARTRGGGGAGGVRGGSVRPAQQPESREPAPKRRPPQAQRSRFGSVASRSPYGVVALPLDPALAGRHQFK